MTLLQRVFYIILCALPGLFVSRKPVCSSAVFVIHCPSCNFNHTQPSQISHEYHNYCFLSIATWFFSFFFLLSVSWCSLNILSFPTFYFTLLSHLNKEEKKDLRHQQSRSSISEWGSAVSQLCKKEAVSRSGCSSMTGSNKDQHIYQPLSISLSPLNGRLRWLVKGGKLKRAGLQINTFKQVYRA